jgi:hypothetical protein
MTQIAGRRLIQQAIERTEAELDDPAGTWRINGQAANRAGVAMDPESINEMRSRARSRLTTLRRLLIALAR